VRNRYGGDALSTTMHGSVNCHDIYGGIAMKLPEEITHGDYPTIARMLIAGGGPASRARGEAATAIQDVLRRAGVPDGE
jgi:hypothetical protein